MTAQELIDQLRTTHARDVDAHMHEHFTNRYPNLSDT